MEYSDIMILKNRTIHEKNPLKHAHTAMKKLGVTKMLKNMFTIFLCKADI